MTKKPYVEFPDMTDVADVAETIAPTRDAAAIATIANIVELEYRVYFSLKDHFGGIEVARSYSYTTLLVPLASGQVGRIRIDVLSDHELEAWKSGTLS